MKISSAAGDVPLRVHLPDGTLSGPKSTAPMKKWVRWRSLDRCENERGRVQEQWIQGMVKASWRDTAFKEGCC
jgi:hypothetical protein